MRTAESTVVPRKRPPILVKRSGTSVTKNEAEPVPSVRAAPLVASVAATSRAVSSAESTIVTLGPR